MSVETAFTERDMKDDEESPLMSGEREDEVSWQRPNVCPWIFYPFGTQQGRRATSTHVVLGTGRDQHLRHNEASKDLVKQ